MGKFTPTKSYTGIIIQQLNVKEWDLWRIIIAGGVERKQVLFFTVGLLVWLHKPVLCLIAGLSYPQVHKERNIKEWIFLTF